MKDEGCLSGLLYSLGRRHAPRVSGWCAWPTNSLKVRQSTIKENNKNCNEYSAGCANPANVFKLRLRRTTEQAKFKEKLKWTQDKNARLCTKYAPGQSSFLEPSFTPKERALSRGSRAAVARRCLAHACVWRESLRGIQRELQL